jgi:hypothetical protein
MGLTRELGLVASRAWRTSSRLIMQPLLGCSRDAQTACTGATSLRNGEAVSKAWCGGAGAKWRTVRCDAHCGPLQLKLVPVLAAVLRCMYMYVCERFEISAVSIGH